MRIAALSALVLIACGPPPKTAEVAVTRTVDKLPDGPPLVTPGEHMAYKLALQGVEIASFDLSAGELAQVNGKQAVVVQGHAKASGLASLVSKIDDKFTAWIDVATGRSLRFETDEFATKSEDREHCQIDTGGRTADAVPISFHLNDAAPTLESQHVALPETWDYNTFLVALRAWEGAPGSAVTLEIFRSRYLWRVTMKIHGKEKLVTDLGELPALRFDGHAVKLLRSGEKDADSDERDFQIWISDDDGRVPLQIVARTDYGDIKMRIVDYQPGSGQRIRQ